MTTTEQLTEKKQNLKNSRSMNEWAVSILADMCYHTSHHIKTIEMIYSFLPTGKLKTFTSKYKAVEALWRDRLLFAFREMGKSFGAEYKADMQRDLEGEEIFAYVDLITDAKRCLDMEGVSEIVKLLANVKDVAAIKNNLTLIIQNQINKEAVC